MPTHPLVTIENWLHDVYIVQDPLYLDFKVLKWSGFYLNFLTGQFSDFSLVQ